MAQAASRKAEEKRSRRIDKRFMDFSQISEFDVEIVGAVECSVAVDGDRESPAGLPGVDSLVVQGAGGIILAGDGGAVGGGDAVTHRDW